MNCAYREEGGGFWDGIRNIGVNLLFLLGFSSHTGGIMVSFILEAKSVRYVSCVNLYMTMKGMTAVTSPMHLADFETTNLSG